MSKVTEDFHLLSLRHQLDWEANAYLTSNNQHRPCKKLHSINPQFWRQVRSQRS